MLTGLVWLYLLTRLWRPIAWLGAWVIALWLPTVIPFPGWVGPVLLLWLILGRPRVRRSG